MRKGKKYISRFKPIEEVKCKIVFFDYGLGSHLMRYKYGCACELNSICMANEYKNGGN